MDSSQKPKRKFAPKAVGRRSEKDRQESAPTIKEEPKERSSTQQTMPRRRREIKGEYLDDVQGPLSAPSLVDPRGGQRRFTGGSGGGGGGVRGSGGAGMASGIHTQQRPGAGANEPQGDRIDVSEDNGFYAPQVVSKTALASEEAPTLDNDKLYLFSVPQLTPPPAEDAMEVDTTTQVGTLRKHASGKVTMLIGEAVYEVTTGVPTTSVQDVVLVKGETAFKIGTVDGRMVLVPNFA